MSGNSSESLRDTLPITKSACIVSANVSRATAWKFFVVCYLINDEYRSRTPAEAVARCLPAVRGIPLRQGKQRVWVPTAKGGASPTLCLYTTDKSVVGAKPPSPHLLSLKMKAQLPLAIGKETFKQKIYPLMLEKER